MTNSNAYNQYKENSIITASPEELTLMLYNGLIKFIMQSQVAINENDFEKAHTSNIRAQDIIIEFEMTLNMDYELSHYLMPIYDYMHHRLLEANIKKSSEILEEVLGFAKDLRDTWSQAMKLAKQPQKMAVGGNIQTPVQNKSSQSPTQQSQANLNTFRPQLAR